MSGRIRVVLAATGADGPDGADRAVESVARALRDAGMEVVYPGARQTPEQVVATAVQEDADLIGLAVHPSAADTSSALFARVLDLLAEQDAAEVIVFAGGEIPPGDVPALLERGVRTVFPPGTSGREIVDWVRAAGSGADCA